MGWSLEHPTLLDWEWGVYHSAFGAAGGTAEGLEAAIVEMVIAEADLLEEPYSTRQRQEMLADPSGWVEKRLTDLPLQLQQRINELRHASVVSVDSTLLS